MGETIDTTVRTATEPAPKPGAVALCVEGGGMRMAYVGAMVCAIARDGLDVDFACGISAGSSVTANFVADIPWRTRAMFVDAVTGERFGGLKSMATGHGYFDADYLYEGCIEDGSYPFDFETFERSPIGYGCQAFEADTGRTAIWTKRDFKDAVDMATHVRASSTMPMMMKPVVIDGHEMYDGGLGVGGGLSFTIAEALGYERFVMVRSRTGDYRKEPLPRYMKDLYFRWAEEKPLVAKALMDRPFVYNETLERLAGIEREGRALVVTPDIMPVSVSTLDYKTLDAAWKAGTEQGERERDRVLAFLKG